MKKKHIFIVLLFFSAVGVFSQCKDFKTAKEYKAKSLKVSKENIKEKSAYLQIAKYYEYICECNNGTNREKKLITLINRIVDVNKSFHLEKYGALVEVVKCKSLKKKLPDSN